MARDDAAGAAAILDWTDDRAVRLAAEAAVEKQRHVLRSRILAIDGNLHRLRDPRRIHPDLFRLLVLPVEALGKIRSSRCSRALRRGRPRPHQDNGDDGECSSLHGRSIVHVMRLMVAVLSGAAAIAAAQPHAPSPMVNDSVTGMTFVELP